MKIYLIVPFFLALALTVLAAIPLVAEAHGEDVLTFSATTTKGYIIDVDYQGLIIEAGISGSFAFNLFSDEARTQPVDFKDLWVRIIEEDGSAMGRTIYAGPVAKPEFGQQGFLYVFPKGGNYRLAVRYNQEQERGVYDRENIEAEIPLTVYRSIKEEQFTFSMEFFVGLSAGVLGTLILGLPLVMRRRKSASG